MKEYITPILTYFALISLMTAVVTAADKLSAKRNKRRVPEKVLFLLAILGGSFSEYLTMRIIRHKTLHKRFMIGLPVIMFLQLALVFMLFFVPTV